MKHHNPPFGRSMTCLLLLCLLLCSVLPLTACTENAAITFVFADDATQNLSCTDAVSFPKNPTRDGFLFTAWKDDEGTEYSLEALAELLAMGKALKVTAVWTPHTHNFDKGRLQEATCQENGYTPYTCTECGYVDKRYWNDMPKTDHHWVSATFDQARYCPDCGLTEGTAINMTFNHEIPQIHLTTDNGQLPTSKEIYLSGSFTMTDSAQYNVPTSACEIRCRGNYTYEFPPKKAYRIRFAEKTSICGLPANRSWTLLADYLDISHIKNFAAYHLASRMDGLDFSPLAQHVNVTFNGQYLGVYLLSDQVNEKDGRLDLDTDLTSLGAEVPFLIELDDYAHRDGPEGTTYFTYQTDKQTLKFSIKYPDETERVSKAQFNYIRQYVTNALNALFGKNGQNWRDYWDEDSMIDYFTVNQWMANGEIHYKSVFISKDLGGKLEMGPVWDFDWGLGGPNWMDKNSGETFSSQGPDYRGNPNAWKSNAWFDYLWKNDPQFVYNFTLRWQQTKQYAYDVIAELKLYKPVIAPYIDHEMKVWDRYQTPRYLNHRYGTASGQYDVVIELLEDHTLWMDQYITLHYQNMCT